MLSEGIRHHRNLKRTNVSVLEVMLPLLLFFCLMIALIDKYMFKKRRKKSGRTWIRLYEPHATPFETWSGYLCCYRVVFSHET